MTATYAKRLEEYQYFELSNVPNEREVKSIMCTLPSNRSTSIQNCCSGPC